MHKCLPAYTCLHHMHTWHPKRPEEDVDPLKLELQKSVIHHMGEPMLQAPKITFITSSRLAKMFWWLFCLSGS